MATLKAKLSKNLAAIEQATAERVEKEKKDSQLEATKTRLNGAWTTTGEPSLADMKLSLKEYGRLLDRTVAINWNVQVRLGINRDRIQRAEARATSLQRSLTDGIRQLEAIPGGIAALDPSLEGDELRIAEESILADMKSGYTPSEEVKKQVAELNYLLGQVATARRFPATLLTIDRSAPAKLSGPVEALTQFDVFDFWEVN